MFCLTGANVDDRDPKVWAVLGKGIVLRTLNNFPVFPRNAFIFKSNCVNLPKSLCYLADSLYFCDKGTKNPN